MSVTLENDYISVPEAAIRAKVVTRTIYRWIREKTIPAFGRGNALRVRMSDVLPPSVHKKCEMNREPAKRLRLDYLEKRSGGRAGNTTPSSVGTEIPQEDRLR